MTGWCERIWTFYSSKEVLVDIKHIINHVTDHFYTWPTTLPAYLFKTAWMCFLLHSNSVLEDGMDEVSRQTWDMEAISSQNRQVSSRALQGSDFLSIACFGIGKLPTVTSSNSCQWSDLAWLWKVTTFSGLTQAPHQHHDRLSNREWFLKGTQDDSHMLLVWSLAEVVNHAIDDLLQINQALIIWAENLPDPVTSFSHRL